MSPEHHDQLRDLAHQSRRLLFGAVSKSLDEPLDVLLDGATSEAINTLLGREQRRTDGIFFSGPKWASRLREAMPHGPFARFVDPSCGVGDLLIEIARHLPLKAELADTVADWAERFSGMDLHAPLAQLAWYRLQALAMRRHGVSSADPETLGTPLGQFDAMDALSQHWSLNAGDCVLMNPPFQSVPSPAWSRCCGGRVSAAALFLERALTDAPAGVTIVALLPEVIRSGSRFARLRHLIQKRGRVHEFAACGRFSHEADIDVAILSVTIGAVDPATTAPADMVTDRAVLSDLAKIRVGTIVPHRDPRSRRSRPYLDVDGAPVWAEASVGVRERFHGTAFRPPFVVVRRTSSPSDRERARATLIRGKEPVMVENHLLVLLPARRTLVACRELMRNLADPRTTAWLNEELRCRHLTVHVMKQLPVWTEV
jgi:hypothetical protein